MRTIRVYCAGKIAAFDWRQNLFPGLARVRTPYAPLSEPSIADARDGRFIYAGPFFMADKHGCPSQGDHGNDELIPEVLYGHQLEIARIETTGLCLRWLRSADVMFVWLNSATAYGTVAEIGAAAAMGIPIFLYEDEDGFPGAEDMWFPRTLADHHFNARNPEHAWLQFTRNPRRDGLTEQKVLINAASRIAN